MRPPSPRKMCYRYPTVNHRGVQTMYSIIYLTIGSTFISAVCNLADWTYSATDLLLTY